MKEKPVKFDITLMFEQFATISRVVDHIQDIRNAQAFVERLPALFEAVTELENSYLFLMHSDPPECADDEVVQLTPVKFHRA